MTTTTKTVAALVVASIGLAALTPSAFAAGPQNGPQRDGGRELHQRHEANGGGQRGGILNLVCAPNGAERLEKALVSLSYKVTLTDAQKPLYDALKTSALTAQTTFADTCAAAMPAPATRPNMVERLQTRLKIDEARTAALTGVLPSLEAFFNSLSDEQKAALDIRGQHDGRGGDHRDGKRGPGRNG
jgi:hypothetical protein